MIKVSRFYTRQGSGFKVVHGYIGFDNLESRSAAYKYMHMKGNKIYLADNGENLIRNIQFDNHLKGQELLDFKLDLQAKIKEAIQTDWKE